jgi:MFS family permease
MNRVVPVAATRRRERGRVMRGVVSLGVLVAFVTGSLASCAMAPEPVVTTPRTYQGAGAGAAVGAGAGALIDKNNRWRGAVIGAALGAALGGTLTEISARASREAAVQNRPIAYQSTDGWQRVEAFPQGAASSGCRQVQERVYQNGQLVREQLREVC